MCIFAQAVREADVPERATRDGGRRVVDGAARGEVGYWEQYVVDDICGDGEAVDGHS